MYQVGYVTTLVRAAMLAAGFGNLPGCRGAESLTAQELSEQDPTRMVQVQGDVFVAREPRFEIPVRFYNPTQRPVLVLRYGSVIGRQLEKRVGATFVKADDLLILSGLHPDLVLEPGAIHETKIAFFPSKFVIEEIPGTYRIRFWMTEVSDDGLTPGTPLLEELSTSNTFVIRDSGTR